MNMNLGTLTAHLTVNNKAFLTGMNAAKSSLDSMANKMRSFGIQWGLLVSAPLTLFGRVAVKEFGKFNQAIVRSSAVLKDSNIAMRKELRKTALELSLTVPTAAVELAKGFYEMGQAGLDSVKAMQLLPVVEEFARVGTMNLSHAVSYLTKSQRALGMEMQDPIKNMIEMKRVADNLTYAAIESTAGLLDFSEAMKNAGPMLRVLNKSIEEGVSALMTLANQGHVGSEAGTQLYMVYRDLQRAFITHKSTWRGLSLDVYDVNRNMRLLPDIIKDLESRFSGMTDEGVRTSLMMLGFQDRSLRATQALLGQSKMMQRFYKDLHDLSGITKTVAELFKGAFLAQMDLLVNKIKYIRIAIGEIVANQLTKLNAILDRLLQVWKDLSQPAKEFIVYFAEVAILIGPAAIAASYLVKGLGTLVGIVGALISPLGILLGLLGYLALSSKTVTKEFGNITDAVGAMYKKVTEGFKTWTTADTLAMEKYAKTIGIELNGLKDKFSNFIKYLQADWIGATAFIGSILLEGLRFAFTQAILLALKAGKGIADALESGLKGAVGLGRKNPFLEEHKRTLKELNSLYESTIESTNRQPYADVIDKALGKPKYPEVYDRLAKQVRAPYMQKVYDRYPDVEEAVKAGASKKEIETMVRFKINNPTLEQIAQDISVSSFSGIESGFEAYFKEFPERIKAIKEGLGDTGAGATYAADNATVDARVAKEKESLDVQTKKAAQVLVQIKAEEEHMSMMFYMEKALVTIEEKRLNDIARLKEKELTWAKDPALQTERQEMANLYQGLEHMTGAYKAHEQLLKAKKILVKNEIGDNEDLNKVFEYRRALLGQMGDDVLRQRLMMYESIQDANGAYEMQLRLLQSEAKILPFLVHNEKLITEYIERQIELEKRRRGKEGDDFFAGMGASFAQMNDDLNSFGQIGFEVGNQLTEGIGGALVDLVNGTKTLEESMKTLGREVGNMLIKWAAMKMITAGLSAAFSSTSAAPPSAGQVGASSPGATHMPGYHTGGIVGSSEGIRRMVSPSVFRGAARAKYGLMPNERPIIAHKDEGVFTPGQMKALGNGSGTKLTDDLLNQILGALMQRQTINAVVVDKRDVVTKQMMESREGESIVMNHVSRNKTNGNPS